MVMCGGGGGGVSSYCLKLLSACGPAEISEFCYLNKRLIHL